jgi:hypothetical protein
MDKKFIFVEIDNYSKYKGDGFQRKTSGIICDATERLIIYKHGTPAKILVYFGLEFKNNNKNKFQPKKR